MEPADTDRARLIYDICNDCPHLSKTGTNVDYILELHCWQAFRENIGFSDKTHIGNLNNDTYKQAKGTYIEIRKNFEDTSKWEFTVKESFETPKGCPYNLEITLLRNKTK